MSNETDDKTKQEYIGNFIRALAQVEAEMLPYQEHRRDLRKSYVQNGWLTKQELSAATKASRMLKNDEDLEQLLDMYEKVSKVSF
jgi:hypothetical protein